jgi:hypothetical protein
VWGKSGESEKVENFIACLGQVPWSCYLVAFHWETQGTFLTLLVPFQNWISERRTLQNKSGEIYRQLMVKKVEKVEKVEKLKSGEISGPKWRNLYIGYMV